MQKKQNSMGDRLPELALIQGSVLIIVHATGCENGFVSLANRIHRDYPGILKVKIVLSMELAGLKLSEVRNYNYVVSFFPSINDFRNDIVASFIGMMGEFVVSGRSYNSVFPKWPVLLRATRRELAAWFTFQAYLFECAFKYAHLAPVVSKCVDGYFGDAINDVENLVKRWLDDHPHLGISLDSYSWSSTKHRKLILSLISDAAVGSSVFGGKVPAQCNYPSPLCKYSRTLADGIDISSLLESSLSKILPRFIINRLNNDTFN